MTSDPIAEAQRNLEYTLEALVSMSCREGVRAAADRLALTVLDKYGEHDMACSHWQESGPCTCGYDALRARLAEGSHRRKP
jgi:3-mercaptopyruvate sulfurtransferase SseA